MPQYLRDNGTVKLSWNSNLTEGIDHNYIVIIINVTSTTLQLATYETVVLPWFWFEQCGDFVIQIRTVNAAGESDPSDSVRVSLPLLPDIQPVSDSLDHRVWKSSGHIMVQILFEVNNSVL